MHKILAFDSSTDQLSIAVLHGAAVHEHTGAGGAQSSATLLPRVLELLARAGLRLAELDAIAFGRGPGSFTGLRTACAVAQGLGFGAGVALLPVDTLLAVAEDARVRCGATQVVAALDARMDEVYFAAYAWQAAESAWRAHGALGLAAPGDVPVPAGWTLAGNARAVYGERLAPAAPSVPALPTAAALLRLAPALIASGARVAAADALPLYLRDKVARTTAERTQDRDAKDRAERAAAARQEPL